LDIMRGGWPEHPQVVVTTPEMLAQALHDLAAQSGDIRFGKTRLVVRRSWQVHDRMNQIRERVEKMPAEVISLIPAALWFIDNFQVIYREIKSLNFSTAGDRPVPLMKSGHWQGLPRAYVMAQAMVSHTQGQLDEDNLELMIRAYQRQRPLTGVELELLPELLGLCLLEHLLSLAERVTLVADAKVQADTFVNERLGEGQEEMDVSALLVAGAGGAHRVSFHSHVLYLMNNLALDEQDQRRYIDFHFEDAWESLSAADIFKEEGREESQLESDIRVSVTSLRTLSQADAETFFTRLSLVEQILSRDPDGAYPQMDSASRGAYRARVGRIGRRLKLEETQVAETCLALARAGHPGLHQPHHVGSYLMDRGEGLLTRELKGKPAPRHLAPRANYRGIAYFVLLGLSATGFLALIFLLSMAEGTRVWLPLLLLGLPLAVGLGVKLANAVFTRAFPAKHLMAMDYTAGVPESARAMVVMPVILANPKQGLTYLDRLEKHYLANRQDNLYFALLADYADADQAILPTDAALREALLERLQALNARHPGTPQRFSLFLRERRYNPQEGCFMCWERKRGKLEEFNRLLCGQDMGDTSFVEAHTGAGLLSTIHYVVTLDADSELLLDNASRLVGLIDHPLNRAVLDASGKRLLSGYAIIQPQVVNRIARAGDSVFSRVYAGKTGISNYTMAISDIYQDLFNQGIFVGKGVYNVRAFHQLLQGAIPENRVLSHDLLESCYARTGFAGTAQVTESFPVSYASFMKRQHRWIRGDWQLLPWLLRRGLNGLSRWKIIDDLRASLMPPIKVALLFLNLWLLPGRWWLVPALLALPLMVDVLGIAWQLLTRWTQGRRYVLLYRKLLEELALLFGRFALELVFLPHEALSALDAIIRTLYRLTVSKRRMLMWETAERADRSGRGGLPSYLLRMWPVIPLGLGMLALAIWSPLRGLAPALYGALGMAWALSPVLANSLSAQKQPRRPKAADEPQGLLMDSARRSWRFFQDFTTEENHYLMPDNYQIGRKQPLADKTSPTNIGLQMLSALSACDLGFETPAATLDYLERVWQTVRRLPAWHGHLYNWYNTRTLQVLTPHYVSSVDSGNYIGYLIALRQSLLDLADQALLPPALLAELRALMQGAGAEDSLSSRFETCADLARELEAAVSQMANKARQPNNWDARSFVRLATRVLEDIQDYQAQEVPCDAALTLSALAGQGQPRAVTDLARLRHLAEELEAAVQSADFQKLFNPKRRMLYIGFNASTHAYDQSSYDLIASESMLASLVAIAKGDLPSRHWQALGRPLTIIRGRPAHVSWSGTMFEYLLNHLVIQRYEGSVFDDTARAAVTQQQRYARRHKIPWGISESQHHLFDLHHNYQYRAFGVPKLRLQPVYKDMLVVSPYSTMLALEIAPNQALSNLRRLQQLGGYGQYGFYEALDFTVPDPVSLQSYQVVRSFMAHHQGMSLVAINNYVNLGIMRRRFHQAPLINAAQGLLEEKHQSFFATPSRRGYTVTFRRHPASQAHRPAIRHVRAANLTIPAVNYLSNGRYATLVTADGDGFSRLEDILLYRWCPDVYTHTGFYLYVRDLAQQGCWSGAYHPSQARPERYQAVFHNHMTEFIRVDRGITTTTQVSLFPSANLEIRRVKLKNNTARERRLQVTSYMEVVVDRYEAERSHPAFNKMFLDLRYDPQFNLLLASRRNRPGLPLGMQALHTDSQLLGPIEYETSRSRFIGRGGSLQAPQAVLGGRLSGDTQFSGDPIMSLRATLRVKPGEEAVLTFLAGLVEDEQAARAAAQACASAALVNEALARFRRQSLLEFQYIGVSTSQRRVYQNIIRQLYYPHRYLRGGAEHIQNNVLGQSGLWKFGISGDKPIILLDVASASQVTLVRDVLKVYEYLGINGVRLDLVILAQGRHGYYSEVGGMLSALTSQLRAGEAARERTGLYILHAHELEPQEIDLLHTVAHVVFTEQTGIYFRRQMEAR